MDFEAELAAMRAEIAELRASSRRAEDYVAICNLQASYGYYVDKGLWDQAADLFAAEGTLEIAGRGVFRGQDRVREYLHALPPYRDGVLFNHTQLQPVIHVDGDRAEGRWRSLIQFGLLYRLARWGDAVYENRYVRVDGVWRIAALHGFITYYTDWEQGWHRGGVPLVRSIEGLQPDEPPTVAYEAYPAAFIPPFHYANPVSGRE